MSECITFERDTPYTEAPMMDRGTFALFHAWTTEDDWRVEYWRGIQCNGAVIRKLCAGRMISMTHHNSPGEAIRWLGLQGYNIPGLHEGLARY
jgi:hypothetical protein